MSERPSNGGRWVRPAKKNYGPKSVVSLIVEPATAQPDFARGSYLNWFGCVHVAEAHRIRSKWSEIQYQRFDDPEDFWTWLETTPSIHRRVHVFAPHALHAATLLGWWERLERVGALHETRETLRKAKPRSRRRTPGTLERPGIDAQVQPVARDLVYYIRGVSDGSTCQILRYRCNRRSFLWCSHTQYVTCGEDEIAAALNHAFFTTPTANQVRPKLQRTPVERCLMWCRFMCNLAVWWERNNGGPWGATVASCALSFLKKRLADKAILHHNNPHASAIEENAIFGGRRSIWFAGNIGTAAEWERHGIDPPIRADLPTIPGPMVNHDIRSMYPFILATMPFPVQFITVRRGPSLAAVAETLKEYGVIANVELVTHRDDYPMRTPNGITWPLGRFSTTLAGPELLHALANDRIQAVHSAAVYHLGTPFKDTCDALLALRVKYRSQGDGAYELFAKSLANAMSGKVAQREHTRVPRPDKVPPRQWGPWKQLDLGSGLFRNFQTLAGCTWEIVKTETKSRQMGATYAYLTSYGRVLMGWVRSLCPPRSVLAMDTDGLWTTTAALPALYGDRDREPTTPGELTHVATTPVGRFFSPQHYWWGKGWVLSGMNVMQVEPHANKARVKETCAPIFSARHTPEACVIVKDKDVDLGKIHHHGVIGEDGWIVPELHTQGVDPERLRMMGGEEWWN